MEVCVTDESPKIDYGQIDFPSDRLTFKQIRALASKPTYADFPSLEGYLFDHVTGLATMHYIEKNFADVGFAKGTGDPKRIEEAILKLNAGWRDNEPDVVYDEALATQDSVDSLADDYQKFGIADGPETAKQLVRRLEDNAAAQAREKLGRTGGGGG
jgi:hypothetical protein